ncbi:unnamed protein product [Durusdinium trenchii]|uniref:Ion transport domain-containing protein n=1 Tax=Durusdinium trenchii TaxID=1381693 RepID=A0ABP0HBB4_9DINO
MHHSVPPMASDSLNVSYLERAPPRRNANVQAFIRGKESSYADALEFCRQGLGFMGDEILTKVKSEMQQTVNYIKSEVADMKSEVADMVEHHHLTLAAKLESINEKLYSVERIDGAKRSQSPDARSREQNEANRRLVLRREEQILQIHDQLAKMSDQLNKVNKKSDMDQCMQNLAGKIDLQQMLDAQAMNLMQQMRQMHMGTHDVSEVLRELENAKPPQIDLSLISTEIRKTIMIFEEDFRMLMNEITKVQKHLQIDYVEIAAVGQVTGLSVQESTAVPAEGAPTTEGTCPSPSCPSPSPSESASRGSKVMIEGVTFAEEEVVICEDLHIASRVKRSKRVREVSAQTENSRRDEHVQTDLDHQAHKPHHKKKTLPAAKTKVVQPVAQLRPGLQDKDAFKERARKALLRPQYNVFDYYHTTGVCQAIARHFVFDNLTVCVVALNAIWIAVDIDYNTSAVLTQADTVFQVVEHSFCTYFFLEIMIRFGAFAHKRRALMDVWFLFDSVLVANMVVETWLVPIIIIAAGTDAADVLNISFLRMMRMVKLLRLSRISRFIRSVPELVIILKAMGFAARSVLVFFLVWLVIIYIFAVVLRQATDSSTVGTSLFPSVPSAMNTLLLDGLLADYAPLMKSLGSESAILWVVGLAYILLVAITVLYMLVGCLVEAVGAIASSQKEGLAISYVAGSVRAKMARCPLLAFQTPWQIAGILSSVKVDVVILGEMLEMIYEDLERQGEAMTFEKMIELMLNGRGSNTATVRDIKELLRMIRSAIKLSGVETLNKVTEEMGSVAATIQALRIEGAGDSDSDSSSGRSPSVAVSGRPRMHVQETTSVRSGRLGW